MKKKTKAVRIYLIFLKLERQNDRWKEKIFIRGWHFVATQSQHVAQHIPPHLWNLSLGCWWLKIISARGGGRIQTSSLAVISGRLKDTNTKRSIIITRLIREIYSVRMFGGIRSKGFLRYLSLMLCLSLCVYRRLFIFPVLMLPVHLLYSYSYSTHSLSFRQLA